MDKPNREMTEEWAKKFLNKLESLSNTDKNIIEVEMGKGKNNKKYLILKDNLREIIEFGKNKIANDNIKLCSVSRMVNYLLYFADFIGEKSFDDVKKEDIEKYLNDILENKISRKKKKKISERYFFILKLTIRSFFKWFYKCEEPEVTKWMNVILPKNNKIPEIIELDEIQKMIKVCDNPRDKALISVLYESGARISELLDLKIGDVKFDEYGAVLKVSGKTGERFIRIIHSIGELKDWMNKHPSKDNINSPLFCSFSFKNYGSFIKSTSACILIKTIAKRAGIDKERNIHPHMFRHKRVTDLSGVLQDRELILYFGWSANSSMPSHYSHLNAKDLDNKMLKLSGVKIDEKLVNPKLATVTCYKCKEVNSITNKFCWKCFTPLSEEGIKETEQLTEFTKVITNAYMEMLKMREISPAEFDRRMEALKELAKKNEKKGGDKDGKVIESE